MFICQLSVCLHFSAFGNKKSFFFSLFANSYSNGEECVIGHCTNACMKSHIQENSRQKLFKSKPLYPHIEYVSMCVCIYMSYRRMKMLTDITLLRIIFMLMAEGKIENGTIRYCDNLWARFVYCVVHVCICVYKALVCHVPNVGTIRTYSGYYETIKLTYGWLLFHICCTRRPHSNAFPLHWRTLRR